ncbi:Hydroxyneurosporene-O-methyltransferase OS=Streptomyces fumanus OX=67302 GN=GCM10018772_39400 PE=4 SV=1 [Streptomyces fumanus]
MSEVSSSIRVREDMYAGWLSAAVYSAARLRVAGKLADGRLGVDEVAERTGTDAGSLYRLLRAQAGAGCFRAEAGRRFGASHGRPGHRDAPGTCGS